MKNLIGFFCYIHICKFHTVYYIYPHIPKNTVIFNMLIVLCTHSSHILLVVCPEMQVRNEPKNISVSAEYISKIKGVSLEKVMEVTTQNALRLFPKLKSAIRP